MAGFVRPFAAAVCLVLMIVVGATSAFSARPKPPKPTPTPTATPTPANPYIQVCGLRLCLGGQPWGPLHGATAYGAYDTPTAEVALAKEAGLNAVELVNYATIHHDYASQTSAATLARVDGMVKAAKDQGLRIVWNFSGYGHSLARRGDNMTTHDWGPFLTAMANRVNPLTGVAYKNEPTIAMLEIMGEIPPPNSSEPGRGTTAETLAFYDRTLTQLKAAFPNHLATTGGFSHLNWNSGIPWQQIMSLPHNPICQFEINSWNDRDTTTNMVTSYCQGLNKPWQLAAFSSCQGPPDGTWDINHWPGDPQMAAHHDDMYRIARGGAPATYPALASQFWNLRDDNAEDGECSIGHQYPQTLAKVQAWAP